LKPQQICEPAGVKQTISSQFFSIFELGGITKHLTTGPTGNSKFCFPVTLNVPLGFASRNIDGLEETKLTVSLGAGYFKVLIVLGLGTLFLLFVLLPS